MRRRVALVTGGSRGIGRACVLEFARRGLDVALTYRNSSVAATEVVGECARSAAHVQAFQYDLLVSDPGELIAAITAHFGSLDSVVLNAGIWQGGRIDQLDPESWWDVVETNLRGTYRLARECIAPLTNSGRGSLVLMSSAVALTGFPGDTAYASAKSAIVGFTRSLAREVVRDGVRVNAVAPGFVETDMTAEVPESSRRRIVAETPMGRLGRAEEIARTVAFLSEDATFTTGVILPADGGWSV
jgi:3-oxoacyl-[acyl-carrier protein] reductase